MAHVKKKKEKTRNTENNPNTVNQPKPARKKGFLDGLKWSRGSDLWITLSAFGLIAFGTLMVLTTIQGIDVGSISGLGITLMKQGFFLVMSYLLMWGFDRWFTYYRFKIFQWLAYGGFLAVMFFTAFFGIDNYGSRAWLGLGPVTIQPSEFAKPLMIMAIALAVHEAIRKKALRKSGITLYLKPFCLLFGIVVSLYFQHDFGTMIIVFIISYLCTLVPSWKSLDSYKKCTLLVLCTFLILGILLIINVDWISENLPVPTQVAHILTRIRNTINPYIDTYGEGYQPANALYGIADGGLFGKGFGNSARKYGYLTQAESDYILAVTIEELGIFGLGLIVILYGVICYRLLHWASRATSQADKTLLCGTAAYFILHFIINAGGVGGLIPMTGIPLLFISSGGSSIMAASVALGVAQARIASIQMTMIRLNREKSNRLAQQALNERIEREGV